MIVSMAGRSVDNLQCSPGCSIDTVVEYGIFRILTTLTANSINTYFENGLLLQPDLT